MPTSRELKRATDKLHDAELKLQQVRKKFVDEDDPVKKADIKKDLIDLNMDVKAAKKEFSLALGAEDEELFDHKELRTTIRRQLKEEMSKFSYDIVKDLLDSYGDLTIFSDRTKKEYYLSNSDPDLESSFSPGESSIIVLDKDANEEEITYDEIGFIEAGGKRHKSPVMENVKFKKTRHGKNK